MIGIYKITNPEGKIYIGCSTNLDKRKLKYSYVDCKSQPKLYESLNKFGWKNHLWNIIEECNDEQLFEKEKYYIKKYNSYNDGLNSNEGGFGTIYHTNETKSKISEARQGWIPSKERGEKIGNKIKGRKYTEEHKSKISKALKGKPNGLKGRTSPNKDNSYSLEVREKMSYLKKGTSHSLETKQKMSQSNKKRTKIEQYNLENELIKIWDCIADAKKYIKKGDIWGCLKGKQKTAGGYIWKYVS